MGCSQMLNKNRNQVVSDISVVIPAHNEENRIGRCLAALCSQTIKPREIIVVNNNSSDNTARIAATFPGVKVIDEPNQGIFFARTRGFNAAQGSIIARTDADTIPSLNWLEVIQKRLDDQSIGAVTGPFGYYDMPCQAISGWAEACIRGLLARTARKSKFLAGANMAFRRSDWQSLRPHVCSDAMLHEDLDLAIHLSQAGKRLYFDPGLRVTTSARRIATQKATFGHYMARYEYTYNQHDIYGSSIKVPLLIYLSMQPLLRLTFIAYNRGWRRPKLQRLFVVWRGSSLVSSWYGLTVAITLFL